jgi:hypothetical protein
MNPSNLKYAKTHEWVSLQGNVATVGISDFAVKELTDVVHIELPQTGRRRGRDPLARLKRQGGFGVRSARRQIVGSITLSDPTWASTEDRLAKLDRQAEMTNPSEATSCCPSRSTKVIVRRTESSC